MDDLVNSKDIAPVDAESDPPITRNSSVRDVMRHVAFIHRASLERLAAYDRGEFEYVRRTEIDPQSERARRLRRSQESEAPPVPTGTDEPLFTPGKVAE